MSEQERRLQGHQKRGREQDDHRERSAPDNDRRSEPGQRVTYEDGTPQQDETADEGEA